VNEALHSLTIWGAYRHFEEDSKDSLEPGKVAESVVLSADPFAVDIEKLGDLTVVETIKDVTSIYRADVRTKVGLAPELPVLPRGARSEEERARPARHRHAVSPRPCGRGGCTLSHIATMGRRELAVQTRWPEGLTSSDGAAKRPSNTSMSAPSPTCRWPRPAPCSYRSSRSPCWVRCRGAVTRSLRCWREHGASGE
jgi:hypothetical protein